MEEEPLLLLMDGHAMVHRAWFAIPNPLTIRRTGEEVRGVYGFAQMVRKAVADYRPTYVVLTFDTAGPTFRHLEFEAYKANRPAMPDDLHQQFAHVRRLMEAFRVPILELDGYEADDLLGTLSAQAEAQGLKTLILTGDTDLLQLVSPHVIVLLQYKIAEQLTFDETRVRERYGGLSPLQLIQMKALKGDPSDNIPGLPGIGEKTATKLIQQFGAVQGIYDNLDQLPEKQRLIFETHREQAFQGVRLITIDRNAPVQLDLERSRWGDYDRAQVVQVLRDLEFFSLISWLPLGEETEAENGAAPTPPQATDVPLDYKTVTDDAGLDTLVRALTTAGRFALDTETAPLDPEVKGEVDAMRSRLVGLSFSTAPGVAWYVPVGHAEGDQLDLATVLGRLKPLLEDPQLTIAAHKANFDMTVLGSQGITMTHLGFDTMVAAHLMGRKAIGLKNLALDLLGEEMTPISDLIGTGRKQITMDQVPIQQVAPYACADADMTYRIWKLLEEDVDRSSAQRLFTDVEMPLTPVLVAMQVQGITLDVEQMHGMAESLGRRIGELESETYESVGHRFNLGSPAQFGELLFGELRLHEKMEWKSPRRTKTGAYSTDASILEELAKHHAHPVVGLVLEHRQLSKLKSTYVDALPALVNPKTGRVHTSYNQAGSITGRVSSNDPNMQNIPIRTAEGRLIRNAFIPAEPGWSLIGADYSQIELRVLAHLSQDPALLEAFDQDLDIHAATAAQVFNVALGDVTADHRRLAKVLNFGVIYGLSAFGIAQQTELSVEEGRAFIDSYFGRYPGIQDYIDRTKAQARELGYVETLMGRRRYLPEVNSSNNHVRQAAEREAVNTPIQGTAAEAMKISMVKVYHRMKESGLRSHMLLQVHDELIFEAPADEIEPLKALALEVMPQAMDLAVPLKVAVKVGASWGELE
jgi:DNA polymerase-1